MLKRAKPTLARSRWSSDGPPDARGVFVDETVCARCYQCVDLASSTFAIHTDSDRDDKAYVALQYGDAVEVVTQAVESCPVQAIKYFSRDSLPLLEYAMTKSSKLRKRAAGDEVPGPWEIFQDFLVDELLEMDMERAKREAEDPLADARMAEELSDKAAAIYQAAVAVP